MMPNFRDETQWRAFSDSFRELLIAAFDITEAVAGGRENVNLDLSFPPDELGPRLDNMATLLEATATNFRNVADIEKDHQSADN